MSFLAIDVVLTRVIGGALTHPALHEQMQDSESLKQANAEAIDAINVQDSSATIDLQRNANSQHTEPGLLSENEKCLLYFYRCIHQRLSSANQQKIPVTEIAS